MGNIEGTLAWVIPLMNQEPEKSLIMEQIDCRVSSADGNLKQKRQSNGICVQNTTSIFFLKKTSFRRHKKEALAVLYLERMVGLNLRMSKGKNFSPGAQW